MKRTDALSMHETLRRLPRQAWQAFREWLQPAPRIDRPQAVTAWSGVPELEPSAALMERLRALPRQIVLCRDVDRRWNELLETDGAGPAPKPVSSEMVALHRHVDACARCQTVVAALEAAVHLPRLELPARLVFRLPAVARKKPRQQQRLPRSLREPRWALAASLLMALALQLWIGDPQAFAEGSRVRLESSVLGAVTQTRSRAEVWWSQVVRQISTEVQPVLVSGREELGGYSKLWQQEAEDLAAGVEALRCRAAVAGWTSPETWAREERWQASWLLGLLSQKEAVSPEDAVFQEETDAQTEMTTNSNSNDD